MTLPSRPFCVQETSSLHASCLRIDFGASLENCQLILGVGDPDTVREYRLDCADHYLMVTMGDNVLPLHLPLRNRAVLRLCSIWRGNKKGTRLMRHERSCEINVSAIHNVDGAGLWQQ